MGMPTCEYDAFERERERESLVSFVFVIDLTAVLGLHWGLPPAPPPSRQPDRPISTPHRSDLRQCRDGESQTVKQLWHALSIDPPTHTPRPDTQTPSIVGTTFRAVTTVRLLYGRAIIRYPQDHKKKRKEKKLTLSSLRPIPSQGSCMHRTVSAKASLAVSSGPSNITSSCTWNETDRQTLSVFCLFLCLSSRGKMK